MASPSESKVDDTEVTSRREPGQPNGGAQEQQGDNIPIPNLGRQSSIYSLTLDEIQNTVCEPGKTFGSMNMDEFLNNIWSAEEGFGTNSSSNNNNNNASNSSNVAVAVVSDSAAVVPNGERPAGAQLHRQGSLTVPAPLCRKTVDEVWAEIHGPPAAAEEDEDEEASNGHSNSGRGPQQPHRQATFGEMTLEDFLIKAGVVRGGLSPASSNPPVDAPADPMQQQNYAGYVVGLGLGPGLDEYEYRHRQNGNGKRYANEYGAVRVGSPASPVSSDGMGGGQVDDSGFAGAGSSAAGGGGGVVAEGNGNGTARGNGKKRAAEGGVEKVVERRQRRMIKNRESAARSRARKQAYTVELEAELNLLKEENARLREEERRAQAIRKQMILDCMTKHAQANATKAACSLRRCKSGLW